MKTLVTALTLGTLIGVSTLLESSHARPLESARERAIALALQFAM